MDPGLPETPSVEDELNIVVENPLQPSSSKERQQPTYTIPTTEQQWRSCRLACGLATPPALLNKLQRLESWNQRELKNWEKVIVIAVAVVDLDRGEDEDNLKYGKTYSGRMSSITYRKDRAAVLNLIKMFDRLYGRLEHRAFELLVIWGPYIPSLLNRSIAHLLLDIPLTRLRKWTSRTFDEFLTTFPEISFRPVEEEQASLTFYVPFLVQLLRPQYNLHVIQRALKTRTLTQKDLDRFQQNYRTRQCPPSLLSTLGDSRTPHCKLDATSSRPSQQLLTSNEDDSELNSNLHLDKMFPAVVGIDIDGYTTFYMSLELRRKASLAYNRQEVCNRIEKQNTCIFQYEWSDEFHLPVADQAIDDLVRITFQGKNIHIKLSRKVYAGVLRQTDILRQKAYLRHRGHLRVESQRLQIIIPTTQPEECSYVSLSSSELSISKFEDRIAWRADRGLLLEQGTVLSTKGNLFFISIVMPLSSD